MIIPCLAPVLWNENTTVADGPMLFRRAFEVTTSRILSFQAKKWHADFAYTYFLTVEILAVWFLKAKDTPLPDTRRIEDAI